MNGRVYDPLTAQFFSPDPILQAPGDWLNYNRYGYCMGNPFKFTDPSGKSWKSILTAVASIGVGIGVTLLTVGTGTAPALLIAAGILGASASGVTSAVLGTALNGGSFGDCFMAGTKGAIFSGASAMATAGIGDIFGSVGDLGNEILRAGAHATAQGGISELSGGDFWQGAAAGVFGSLGGSAFQAYGGALKNSVLGVVVFSALSGGIGAELSGGDFWQGAATGAIVGVLNFAEHKKEEYKFFEKLRKNYESKTGKEICLTRKEFDYLLSKGKIKWETSRFNDKTNIFSAIIDFYDSNTDLKLSFGRATVYYIDNDGKAIFTGFHDKYDFDTKPWGTRSIPNEIITRGYNAYSSGKSFEINY